MENNKAFVQYKYSYTILHYKYRDENIFFCGFVYITRKLIYYFYDQSNLIDFGKNGWNINSPIWCHWSVSMTPKT